MKHLIFVSSRVYHFISQLIFTWCQIWQKLTMKTPERRHFRRSDIFTVNFEHILHLFLVFLFLTFEQVNVSCDISYLVSLLKLNWKKH